MTQQIQNNFKVLVIGPPASGKTCFIRRLIENMFNFNYVASVGVAFHNYHILSNGSKNTLMLWDLAGQDHFKTLSQVYCRHAYGCFIVVDATVEKLVMLD